MNLDAAVGLCKQFEGLYLKPYLCPAGVPTIGYGATYYEDGRRVSLSDAPITPERAEELLLWELNKVSAPAVVRLCPELAAWCQTNKRWGPFNAAVDFTFNLGAGRLQTSTLRRELRALNWEGAREQIMRWNRAGGKVLRGLTLRRQAEAVFLG